MSLDFERARFNMIEQQVRPWEVLDQRVLGVMRDVRREDFVPSRYRRLAFADVELPIGHDETMMKPIVEGRLLQALEVQPTDAVLEIGTGSGFVTACLARLGCQVSSVELHADLAESARQRLAGAGCANVAVEVGDAMRDWQPGRRFDVIAVTGAVHEIPARFRDWLAVGGRLFVVRGASPVQEAVLVTRVGEDRYTEDSLFETDLKYLIHAEPPRAFML
jgi:protein-L-isoaspartate(D-aspartate) O-methyltransferase